MYSFQVFRYRSLDENAACFAWACSSQGLFSRLFTHDPAQPPSFLIPFAHLAWGSALVFRDNGDAHRDQHMKAFYYKSISSACFRPSVKPLRLTLKKPFPPPPLDFSFEPQAFILAGTDLGFELNIPQALAEGKLLWPLEKSVTMTMMVLFRYAIFPATRH